VRLNAWLGIARFMYETLRLFTTVPRTAYRRPHPTKHGSGYKHLQRGNGQPFNAAQCIRWQSMRNVKCEQRDEKHASHTCNDNRRWRRQWTEAECCSEDDPRQDDPNHDEEREQSPPVANE